jgi:hypothetical protein
VNAQPAASQAGLSERIRLELAENPRRRAGVRVQTSTNIHGLPFSGRGSLSVAAWLGAWKQSARRQRASSAIHLLGDGAGLGGDF